MNGTIPENLWSLTKLQVLSLGQNQFSGTLSSKIGQLTSLRHLSLEDAGLSGDLPETLSELAAIESVHLQFNDFKGNVPEGLCEIPAPLDLRADCAGQGRIDCSCCTVCCSSKNEQRQCREQR